MAAISLEQRLYRFMGHPLHCLTEEETLQVLGAAVKEKTPMVHCVINAGKIVAARGSGALREAIAAADVINADGQSIVWFGRLARIPVPERVTGIDLMDRLLQLAHDERLSVFLLGATDAVLERSLVQIKRRFPSIAVLQGRNGYFTDDEERAVCEQISACKPDILLLGMSSPRKEVFAARYGRTLAPVTIGVGGAFDILAGYTKRAPRMFRAIGLEWLYRLLQEPRRMWRRYIIGNAKFVWLWALWMIAAK